MLTKSYGPFLKGVVDGINLDLDTTGVLRYARNFVYNGVGRLMVRPGTQVAMTLKDDVGGNVTSVLKIQDFADGAIAVAHSTVTQKFYLYRLDAGLTGWYDAGGTFNANLNPQPVGTLWGTNPPGPAAPLPAPVYIAEGLLEAFIAHSQAGNSFQTKRYSVSGGLNDLLGQCQTPPAGAPEKTFFRGVVSFQSHLWGWGYGSQKSGENDRPELARYGHAIFGVDTDGYFSPPDSIVIGHRVRAARERIVAAVPAGEVLYFGTPQSVWPMTGFGRNSWDSSRPRDDKFGFASGQCAVDAGGVLYYWSRRGPMRISGLGDSEPLWDRLPRETTLVTNPDTIVAVFESDRDQVIWFYRDQISGRVSRLAAFDTERDAFLGPDGDIGLGIASAGFILPTVFPGPIGPPNTPSTTNIGGTVATANWVNGDTSPGVTTIVEVRVVGTTNWTVAGIVNDGQPPNLQITGLTSATNYEWRAKHRKNGQDSAYLGPVAGTTFTTAAQLAAPTSCALNWFGGGDPYVHASWVNQEPGASTEVWFAPPGGAFVLGNTVPPGVASEVFPINGRTGIWQAKVRHVRVGYTTSNYSNVATKTV